MKEPHYQLVYSTKDHPSDALVLEPTTQRGDFVYADADKKSVKFKPNKNGKWLVADKIDFKPIDNASYDSGRLDPYDLWNV